jgi:hypothetical protein
VGSAGTSPDSGPPFDAVDAGGYRVLLADGGSLIRFQGFIGSWSAPALNDTVYAGEGTPANTPVQDAFQFGNDAHVNEIGAGASFFQDAVNATFDINFLLGIALPPTEQGVVNAPSDTSLWVPAAQPGMIQAAHRFSELSTAYPQVQGLILDDFWQNWNAGKINATQMSQIKAALQGKALLADGTPDLSSPSTTPNLKLYIVVYRAELGAAPDPQVLALIDGVSFWFYNQDSEYKAYSYSNAIQTLQTSYPGKEIVPGVYLYNNLGEFSTASIYPILDENIQLYDQGVTTGLTIYTGDHLSMQYVSLTRWQQIGMLEHLDALYYPYLGAITGTALDASTGAALQGATVLATRSVNGRSVLVAQKLTDASGQFRLGVWAGTLGLRSPVSISISATGHSAINRSTSVSAQQITALGPIALP